MKLEITGRVKNPHIGREELKFEVSDCVKTPARKEIRAKIAALCNAKEESVAIGRIVERFGEHGVTGEATVYPSKEKMEAVEEKFIINRNLGIKGRPKKEEKKAARPAGKKADGGGNAGAEGAAPAAEKKGGQGGKEKPAEPQHAGGGKAEAAGAAKEGAAKAGTEKPAGKAEVK